MTNGEQISREARRIAALDNEDIRAAEIEALVLDNTRRGIDFAVQRILSSVARRDEAA